MNEYKLGNFKAWLEANKASQGGMEEHWEYFLSWYEENPDIWEATVEREMRSAGYEQVKFEKWNDYDKEIENLYNAIFIWKREVDSNQSKKHLSGYEQQKVLLSQIPVVEWTKEEAELRKEIRQLKSDIKEEKTKSQENQEKIQILEQKNIDLKSKCRKQEEKLEKMTTLQQQLKLTQNRIKELEHELGMTIQTAENSTQTGSGWEEEMKQKDLKIEELKQQLAKAKTTTIKSQKISSNLKDASWTNLVNKNQPESFIKPSQLKKIRQEQRSTQTQNKVCEQNTTNQEANYLIQEQNLIPKK